MPPEVLIVGGGLTGLSAAYELERLGVPYWLFEPETLGGKVRTVRQDGFLIEEGADCFFTHKPAALELIRELGLESELVEPLQSRFALRLEGRLYPVPRGLIAFGRPDPEEIEAAPFLSEEGKARAKHPQGGAMPEDLSISAFFGRKLGPEFTQKLVEPLLAGTHAGDPERLSMRALYPQYLETRSPEGSRPPVGPAFLSLQGGMGQLIAALTQAIPSERHVRARVRTVEAGAVTLDSGERLAAKRILITVAAPVAGEMLRLRALGGLPMASSAIVTLGYPREIAVEGTGYLVPPAERRPVTGCTWSSAKWPGRALAGSSLLRVFLGRRGEFDVEHISDETLFRLAEREAWETLGELGTPLLKKLTRWHRALPQYEVGHGRWLEEVLAALPTGVALAGTCYRGVGVPDCIRQGREAARDLAKN